MEKIGAQAALFDQRDRAFVQHRDDQAGKAGAGAEIDPGRARRRRETEKLRRIGDVPI